MFYTRFMHEHSTICFQHVGHDSPASTGKTFWQRSTHFTLVNAGRQPHMARLDTTIPLQEIRVQQIGIILPRISQAF